MRFQNEGQGGDIQDRRGMGTGMKVGGLGIGGVIFVAIVSLIMGRNPIDVLNQTAGGQGGGPTAPAGPRNQAEAQAERLVRSATTDIQNFWQQTLPSQLSGRQYQRTQLVLFSDATRSGCGSASAQTGPFYCPADQLVYIDLAFYGELDQRFGAAGDFAQAYVLAHEFGHHVQHILGIDRRVRAMEQANRGAANQLSVAMELQADCLAGVWGNSASRRGMLEANDVEEGMNAAASIGDDRMQRHAGRAVNPERFTHGSSAQRVAWFRRGLESGNITACDTFGNGTMAP